MMHIESKEARDGEKQHSYTKNDIVKWMEQQQEEDTDLW